MNRQRIRRVIRQLAASLPTLVLIVSCTSDPTCGVQGATNVCVCTSGGYGAQVCLGDGSWGPCECDRPGDSSGESPMDLAAESRAGIDAIAADAIPLPPADVREIRWVEVWEGEAGADLPESEGVLVTDAAVSQDIDLASGDQLSGGHDSAGDNVGAEEVESIGCDDDDICDVGEGVECPGCAAVTVVAGGLHTCALREDKSTWCWGAISGMMPASVGGTLHARHVCTAWSHACALTDTGTVWCWGANQVGQVGNGEEAPLFLDPQPVSNLAEVSVLSCGDSGSAGVVGPVDGGHACVVVEDDSVWCWGNGDSGQLGNGAMSGSKVPVQPVSF